LLFRLFDGVIDRYYTEKDSVDSIFFDVYELKISPGPEFAGGTATSSGRRQDLPTNKLFAEGDRRIRENIQYPQVFYMEYYRRYSMPLACFLMAIIGMPLGSSFRTKGRNFGLVIGLAIFVIYYFLFTLGWTLGEMTYVSPAKSVWLPLAVVALVAGWLLIGINKTSPFDPKETLVIIKNFFSPFSKINKNGNREAPK
jgi:lipopolysaccharide export system permease protein